jgi:class 3 adenylate cyclase
MLVRDELDPFTLRFVDRAQEGAYQTEFYRRNLLNVRAAHVLGIVMWMLWGLLVPRFLTDERGLDLAVRYGALIPILLIGLGLSFTRVYPRIWQGETVAVIVLSSFIWIGYTASIEAMPFDFGYVGLILIMAFSYTLVRMRFVYVAASSTVMVVAYVAATLAGQDPFSRLLLAAYYLGSFWLLGLVASYVLERSMRLVFLRERQLDRERARSDALLLNILPRAIVDRLKARQEEAGGGRLAEGLREVTVVFADLADFTRLAERTPPDELVAALDDLFTRFDGLADRFGLEKIKTVGDAYMAVAGAPDPRPDHTEAAADLALAILEILRGSTWPTGDPIRVRVGMATGPAVAGVIGQRKFAYDLWGDTVNLASRLEANGEPGRILVSESVVERLAGRYAFGPVTVIDVKGKGPTRARFLLGRDGDGSS